MVAFMGGHPTAANLMMLMFLALGAVSLGDLRRETFPDFSEDAVEITAAYPGATAEDVETAVCQRIEDAVESVSYISEIQSTAMENQGRVVVKMTAAGTMTPFLNDIKTQVEAIDDFPGEVENVIVQEINRTDQVVSIAVTGPMGAVHLKRFCQDLKDRLKRNHRISQVAVLGFSGHEFRVEIAFATMMRLGLSISDIQAAVTAQNIDLPVGSLETRDRDILIRFSEERNQVQDLSDLIVVSSATGAEIRLGEIAKISDRFMDEEDKILFNGRRAGILQINKTKTQDALEIMDAVAAFLEKERLKVPPGVRLDLTQNVSEIVRDRLQMLVKNAVQGLVLVFCAMLIFFPLRFSFWVVMGLPISFALTFFFMKHLNLSLNMLSMVGLLIGVGILMDDAIVIAENVAANLERGKNGFRATVDGITDVAPGVFSSFLTTCFVFGALALSMKGDIGKVLYVIPVILILTLLVSLVEAFFILPSHLAHSLKHHAPDPGRLRLKIDAGTAWVRERVLGQIVDLAVDFRYFFVGLVVFVFLASIAMLAGGILKARAFPEIDGDVIQARVLFAQGTPLERTAKYVNRLVAAAEAVNQELTPKQPGGQKLIAHTSVLYNTNADAGESGPHVATVSLDLLGAEIRTATIDEVIHQWREKVGQIPGAIALAFKEPAIGPGGLPIQIRLQGQRLQDLKMASTRLMNWLYQYQGVFDLYDDLRPGKPEFRVTLKPGARAKGFTARSVSDQLRAAFYGATASEIIVGDQAYEVNVGMADRDRAGVACLEQFFLMGPAGDRVPLTAVAEIVQDRGYAGIRRVDSIRTVTITGDLDTAVANAADIIAHTRQNFLPQLKNDFPDISMELEGQAKEMKASMGGMVTAMLIGLFGIFCLLSFQFKSYQEPLVVMVTIPLAFIGVVWGHLALGLELAMPSIMGFISLAGIVVNDSILLVTFVKAHTARGQDVVTAGKLASRERFRAVMLTSVTTIAGLLPLMAERSLQAQILIPLACSIVFGLMVSTVLVLVVVPSLYAILGDFNLVRIDRTGQ
jgi:multidrug efflux pump subunit AcrB